MSAANKLAESARKGLRELERGLHDLPDDAAVERIADSLEDDEVVVLVLTKHRALVRRKVVDGRLLTAKEIRLRLAGAEAAIDDLVGAQPAADPPQLTAPEADLLDRAGFRAGEESVPTAIERSRIELEMLLRKSLTIDEAARALGVTTSRIRQRLSQRTLYGVKDGRSWRIPRFQFASKGRLVRNLELVLPHIRADAHPLAIQNWATQPHEDLVIGDEEQHVSPLEWLGAGRAPEIVAKLADEI